MPIAQDRWLIREATLKPIDANPLAMPTALLRALLGAYPIYPAREYAIYDQTMGDAIKSSPVYPSNPVEFFRNQMPFLSPIVISRIDSNESQPVSREKTASAIPNFIDT
jgi:hypothetical protein